MAQVGGSVGGMISVELVGIQVDPISGAAALVLREHDAPNRLLPIMVGQADASSVAIAASGNRFPRPMSHDIMAALVDALDGHLDAVEVTELQEGTFLANLAVSGPSGQHRIDTRPSDAIALAVRMHAPLFVSEAVLDEAGAVPIELPDPSDEQEQLALEAAIDAEVDEFRSFLDDLDPADFIDTTATETTGRSDVAEPGDDDAAAGSGDRLATPTATTRRPPTAPDL
jgi:uncharacterized protein